MFHHVKELQFNARVSGPDPKFAALLLEQFGGGNGELKAAMQYFVQAFGVRQTYPKTYDLLMDIATEEFSHLEIVGATIQMLLGPINGELKDAVETNPVVGLADGKRSTKEGVIAAALANPEFLVLSGGTPTLTNAQGYPWNATYVNANGDPTVDLRSNIAAESRAKIVYEYLLKFTDDPYVRETLQFLMTREITHFAQFTAALDQIKPNFPPGILQGDQRYTHLAFNMSNGVSATGPWNQGQGPWDKGEQWQYVEEPIEFVRETNGLTDIKPKGTNLSQKQADAIAEGLADTRSGEISAAVPKGKNQWSDFPQTKLESPRKIA